MAEQLTRVQV